MQDMTDAISQVLFQMSMVNEQLTRKYVKIEDWELTIQEDRLLDWVRKLVAQSEYPQSNAERLQTYEESLEEFQAKRACVSYDARGDKPQGFEVWEQVKGRKVPLELKEELDADEEDDDAEYFTLNTLEEADQFFKDNCLTDAAEKLGIDTRRAADLKVAIPLLIHERGVKV